MTSESFIYDPRIGAPAQTKRAFSQMSWMIRNLETRCCAWIRITTALLSGSKTGACGGFYQRTEIHNRSGGYMDIYTVLLVVILTFGTGFVLNWLID
jgi:hypothetical protein